MTDIIRGAAHNCARALEAVTAERDALKALNAELVEVLEGVTPSHYWGESVEKYTYHLKARDLLAKAKAGAA